MSQLNDDLEHLELDYLRHQALSSMTPKKRGGSKRHEHDTHQLESDFGIDELLGSEKIHRARHSTRRRGRTTPEISREVIETFSSRPRRTDHYHGPTSRGDHYHSVKFPPSSHYERGRSDRPLQRGQIGKKRRRRSSSGSSYSSASRSSFSSSRSTSRTRSRSSSSSSRSSSTRSHSSTSSSYSHSSRSSSRSRSPTPSWYKKGKKRTLPSNIPQSYRSHTYEKKVIKKPKPSHVAFTSPHPPPERSKRPYPPPRSPDKGWYPEPVSYGRRSPRGRPLRPPPPPSPPPGPPKRRPPPGSEYYDDELGYGQNYYPHERHPQYSRGRPRSPPPPPPPPPRVEQRVVRQVRYPHERPPPPPRDYYEEKPYRRRNTPPFSPPFQRHNYKSDYMPRGRSDRNYPSERGRHPREHPVVPRSNWREDHERYHRRSNVGHYSSDEDGVLHKEKAPVKSSVKVVNKVHKIMRSRSASPIEKRKTRITTVKRVTSETKFVSERVKPKRKSSEVKGSNIVKAKSSPKVPESDKDVASAKSIPVSKVEQAEPKQVEEVPADNEKPEVREEEASSDLLISGEPGLLDEELDYDENMDELDLYPTGSLDVGGGIEEGHTRRPSKSAAAASGDEEAVQEKIDGSVYQKHKRVSGSSKYSDEGTHSDSCSEDSSHPSKHVSPHKKHKGAMSDSESSSNSEKGDSSLIRSPIRVSPERKEPRVVHDTSSSYRKSSSKLPVKERLYVSKRTIEEKKRMIHGQNDSPAKLRPSLANRLGPSPFRRGARHDDQRHYGRGSHRYGGSNLSGRPSKGDAFAIAFAYQRKKRQEELMREEEVQKAKKVTRMLNEPDSKSATAKSVASLRDSKDLTEKERALDKRINEIKQQNKAIVMRGREIEKDKKLYG